MKGQCAVMMVRVTVFRTPYSRGLGAPVCAVCRAHPGPGAGFGSAPCEAIRPASSGSAVAGPQGAAVSCFRARDAPLQSQGHGGPVAEALLHGGPPWRFRARDVEALLRRPCCMEALPGASEPGTWRPCCGGPVASRPSLALQNQGRGGPVAHRARAQPGGPGRRASCLQTTQVLQPCLVVPAGTAGSGPAGGPAQLQTSQGPKYPAASRRWRLTPSHCQPGDSSSASIPYVRPRSAAAAASVRERADGQRTAGRSVAAPGGFTGRKRQPSESCRVVRL